MIEDGKYYFDQEWTNAKDIDDDVHGLTVHKVAEILGVPLEEVWAGNRHNTTELDKVYYDLNSRAPLQIVEVGDEFQTILRLYVYHDMKVLIENELVGVFCVKETAMKILELNKGWEYQ